MYTNVNLRYFRSIVLALILAGLPGLALSQAAPPTATVEITADRGSTPDDSVESLLATAEAFLESPDSGVFDGAADTFENTAATFDPAGRLIARYHRFHNGLRLLGASVKLTVGPGGEVSFNYPPKPFEAPANLFPVIRESQAWTLAAQQMRVDEEGLFGDLELALYPKEGAAQALLVWRVHAFHRDAAPMKFYVDAMTGDVVRREKGYAEESVNVQGTGQMRPESTDGPPVEVDLDTLWHNHSDVYFLVDHSRGGTKVLDMQDGVETDDFKGVDYPHHENEWGNGQDWEPGDPTDGETGQTAAVEALWGAQRTWDMLLNTLNLNGFNGKALPMLLRVHFRQNPNELYSDANFDGRYANLGGISPSSPWSRTELWTVAHELGHGVWHHNVSEDNEGEARGLNEGHGDITAALVLHYARLADGAGPTLPTHERGNMQYFLKRMVNPWEYEIDGHFGLAAYVNGMKHEEEHTQGTAYGHMFALLSMGAPSQPEVDAAPCTDKRFTCLGKASYPLGIAGIGLDKAARIWILATVKFFDDDPTFHEARGAWLNAAAELYGNPSAEYAAVMNAFHLINVGDPAEDLFPPEVAPNPPIVDNYEGSVLLDVSAVDDVGVVMIDVSTGFDSKNVFASRFKGYLDAPAFPGAYVATARAWDASLQWSEANMPFDYTSSNRLFLSRFESWQHIVDEDAGVDEWYVDNWRASTGAMIKDDDPDDAFLGDGYISFSYNRSIERTVLIPAQATQVQLGYRYRVKDNLGLTSGQLRVEILDDQGQLLELAQLITANDDTTQGFSNHYLKNTYTLSQPYAQQAVTIRFRSIDSVVDAFRIDQAFLVYDAIPIVDLDVEVDEREGSVILEAGVTGVQRDLVDYVGFFVDGVEIAQDSYWPYQQIYPTSDFATDIEMSAQAIAYDYFGDPIDSSGLESFEVESIIQAIFNGDFENGDAYWDESGDVAYCNYNPAGGQSHPSFLGNGCMSFTGPASLSRTVWIPGNALSASMSFRFDNNSPEGSAESMTVRIIDNGTGQVLATPLELSGILANSNLGTTHKGYRKHVVDLLPYKGMDFSIEFETSSNGGPLQFFLDNVGGRYATAEGVSGGPGGFGGN